MIANEKLQECRQFLSEEWIGKYKAKNPYNEVQRRYLLGKCFDKIGNKQMAEECMRYVSAHGNTMPCQKKAQEWLLSDKM